MAIKNERDFRAGVIANETAQDFLDVCEYEIKADDADWEVLPGTPVALPPGESWHTLTTDCLALDGTQHVRGRFVPDADRDIATSDLHYVIVDGDACEP